MIIYCIGAYYMKIIDGRLRPPFHSIGAGRLFDPGYAEPLCAKFKSLTTVTIVKEINDHLLY